MKHQPHPQDENLPALWLAAAAAPAVQKDLRALYEAVAREISHHAPACWASGRCCNFTRAGHRLYVTGLEATFTLLHTGDPGTARLADATAGGGCPYQLANLCSAHHDKPLGCRVYFCDTTAQHWQQDLTERALATLRAIHDQHHIPYRYTQWSTLLAMIAPHLPPAAPRFPHAHTPWHDPPPPRATLTILNP